MMAHEAPAPPPSDTDEEEDPACCVLCGEKLDDATCSEHVSRCFDEHLPIDPPPPPAKRQRLSDAVERTGSGQPLFGERMPYLPRDLGILAIDQSALSVADLISMLRVNRVRPTPLRPQPERSATDRPAPAVVAGLHPHDPAQTTRGARGAPRIADAALDAHVRLHAPGVLADVARADPLGRRRGGRVPRARPHGDAAAAQRGYIDGEDAPMADDRGTPCLCEHAVRHRRRLAERPACRA